MLFGNDSRMQIISQGDQGMVAYGIFAYDIAFPWLNNGSIDDFISLLGAMSKRLVQRRHLYDLFFFRDHVSDYYKDYYKDYYSDTDYSDTDYSDTDYKELMTAAIVLFKIMKQISDHEAHVIQFVYEKIMADDVLSTHLRQKISQR